MSSSLSPPTTGGIHPSLNAIPNAGYLAKLRRIKKIQEGLDEAIEDIEALDYCLDNFGFAYEPTYGRKSFRTAVNCYSGASEDALLYLKDMAMIRNEEFTTLIEGALLMRDGL